jgi:nucleoside-diphosphate-sugar epimerase
MIPLVRLVNRFATLPETYTPEAIRSIAGATYLGSKAKARRDLGFAPRRLEEGLPETLLWEMKQAGNTVPARMWAAH